MNKAEERQRKTAKRTRGFSDAGVFIAGKGDSHTHTHTHTGGYPSPTVK